MNEREIRRRFPNAGPGFIAANADPVASDSELHAEGQENWKAQKHELRAEPQRTVRATALGEGEAKGGDSTRYLVRITRVSKRLLDEDNLCGKAVCDFMRYCGAIPSDAPERTSIRNVQRKAAKGEEEHTTVEVFAL